MNKISVFLILIIMGMHTSKCNLEDVFTNVFEVNYWLDSESASGSGSNLKQTTVIRTEIPKLLQSLNIRSMLDAPCGDFYWMKEVNIGNCAYIGADIVQALIEQNNTNYKNELRRFIQADLTTDPLPAVDLIFCRDCLVHLSYTDAYNVLANFKKTGAKYLLTTTFVGRTKNEDTVSPRWRTLNLQIAPFNFPEPIMLINENCTEGGGKYNDKCLGLWYLQDLV